MTVGGGETFELGVEGLVGRAEGVKERLPVLLVLPAVDRQEPVGPNSVAVQLGTSYSHTRTNTTAFDHRPPPRATRRTRHATRRTRHD